MKECFLSVLFLAIVLSVDARAPGQAPDASPPGPARQSDGAAAPVDTASAYRSLETSQLPDTDIFREMVRRAAREHAPLLDLPPEQAAGLLEFNRRRGEDGGDPGGLFDSGPDRLSIWVNLQNVQTGNPKPRAAEFLDAVLATLNARLAEWNAERLGLNRWAQAVREAEVAVAEHRRRLRESEAAVRQLTGRADASFDAIRASIPKLDEERQALKLQVVGKDARQRALAEAIERLAKAAEDRVHKDAVAEELQKIVEARGQAFRRVEKLVKERAGATSDLSEAQAALSEARARLLERREAVAQANGGDLLAALNRELATLSIDAAEAQAKLVAMDALLEKYVRVQEPLDEADDARRQVTKAVSALDAARTQQDAVSRSMPAVALRVIVSESLGPEEARRRAEQEAADQRANEQREAAERAKEQSEPPADQ